MITAAQEDYIIRHAYLPEHVPEYVTAISGTEAFLFGNSLAYAGNGLLIFVGYPLGVPFEANRMERDLEEAVKRLNPERVSLMAPSIPPALGKGDHPPGDAYYRMDLSSAGIPQKTRNMLNRAGRELSVSIISHFGTEHGRLVETFLRNRSPDEGTKFIFARIDRYLLAAKTARIFEARTDRGELVAFDVADFKPRDYALYMFNFRSEAHYVPGASDLLLSAMIRQAVAEGKRYLNLGLGINPGVTFFKLKWGGVSFAPHAFCLYNPSRKGLLAMLFQR